MEGLREENEKRRWLIGLSVLERLINIWKLFFGFSKKSIYMKILVSLILVG